MQIKISNICRVFLALGVLLSCKTAQAADISALDFNGDLLGKVIPDGSVINFDNELIGHITADGFVLDDNNDLIGGVVPQGIAISVDNSILGKVNNDGSVTSVNDSLMGKILPNGLVVNNNYDVIGAAITPGLVYNDDGTIVGRVSGNGKFYNLAGDNNGYVTASGYVYASDVDKKTVLIGKLISSKMVISSTGKFLGSIAPDGKVIDLKKNTIGTIHANGFAYNADGVAIGHIVENGYAFSLDGSYMGVVSYNGEVINKGSVVAQATFDNRVVNQDGAIIGFTVNMATTANQEDGKYLGRITANGAVVKGRTVIGKIGASGNVIDSKGQVIGLINQPGPVFDYLGQLKANATINGKVISFEGLELGYMQKAKAFDRKGKEIGKLLGNRLNFDNNNTFAGINGVTSRLDYKGKNYTISPYGYIFDENGNIGGQNYRFSSIYSPEGNILTNISSNGRTENLTLNDKGKLTSSGFFVDKNDKIIGKTISENYATDFMGESIGYINSTNMVADNKNNLYAKILPDGNVISQSENAIKNYGRAGKASLSISINGDYLGSNADDGHIKNNSEVIGRVTSSEYVVDNMGALFGKAMPFGVIVAPDCKYLGVVSESGDARTSKGGYLGMILTNNQVLNDAEEIIGYIVTPQVVNGKKGEILGIESPLGTVLNYKSQNLGCQDIQGKIRNSQKEIIAQVIPYASAMGFDNKILGYTDLSGKIVSTTGNNVGYVDIDGGVRTTSDEESGVLFRYTVAFDENNIYLGRVNLEGKVISDAGEVIGSVDHNGAVKTAEGKDGFALYDLYVYDNNGKTVGYIAKNGKVYSIMGEMKGAIYGGFVLDKKQNVIARGARDYDIRDNNKKIIGYLGLDGKVINIKNIEVGSLDEDGNIIDNNKKIIATAHPLQYYRKPAESKADDIDEIFEKTKTSKANVDAGAKAEESASNLTKAGEKDNKVLGLGIAPGRKYIGDEEEENEEADAALDTDDEIDDAIEFQDAKAEKPQKVNSKWWQNVVKGVTVSPYDSTNQVSNVGAGGGIGPGGRYNPRRAEILGQLYSTRRQSISGKVISNENDVTSYTGWQDDWSSLDFGKAISSLRVDMSNMITLDKPIPAVLARSIITIDQDGGAAPVTAIVERNVYGEAGRNVIIPAGSRAIGIMEDGDGIAGRFDKSSGGVKVNISWQRIIRPDGIAFDIRGLSRTGDAEGRGGGALGYVDEQMLKKYGVPLLGTVATSAVAYMMAANEDAAANSNIETSKQQAASDARQNFLDKMNDILDKIIEEKEQIVSVTFVPAGTRIIIYPMKDLWLRTTKDVEKHNVSTDVNRQRSNVLIDDRGGKAQDNSVHPVNNGRGQVNNGNNNNNNNKTQPQNVLIEDGKSGNNAKNNNQQNAKTRGLPPPSADGTGMNLSVGDEDDDEGEIDLDF